jgi:hypothetical protein
MPELAFQVFNCDLVPHAAPLQENSGQPAFCGLGEIHLRSDQQPAAEADNNASNKIICLDASIPFDSGIDRDMSSVRSIYDASIFFDPRPFCLNEASRAVMQ